MSTALPSPVRTAIHPAARRPTVLLLAACASVIGWHVPAVTIGQTITMIPTWGPPPVGDDISIAYSLNSNGSVVVGAATAASGRRPFRWTPTGGLQDLGLLSGVTDSHAYDVSHDGNTIVGDRPDNFPTSEPWRWTLAGGLAPLGLFNGTARGVSGDGTIIGGSHPSGGFYRWTSAGGFQNIGIYPGASNTVAFAMSADGSTIVGRGGLGVFGPTNHAVKWSAAGGWVDLGLGPETGANYAVAYAASNDGSYVVGESNFAFPTFIHAIRWNGTVPEDLGIPPNASTVTALAVSADGVAVGGTISPQAGATRAFMWTQTFGIEDLDQYLMARGVDLTGWTQLYEVRAISQDGTALAGWGRHNFIPRAFVVRGLPPVCGPHITEHPSSTIGCVGGVVTLAVTAFSPTNHGPFLQWQKRGSDGEWNDLSNGTTPWGTTFSGTSSYVLTISNCSASDVPGLYRCMVSAGCANRATSIATVGLNTSAPVYTSQPGNFAACPADPVTFVAGPPAPANGPYTFQWERETAPNSGIFVTLVGGSTLGWDGNLPGFGAIVAGQNATTLTIMPDLGQGRTLGPAHARNYRCVATNACGPTPGNSAGLKVWTTCITGDVNCDGVVTVADIGPFVLVLTNPVQYAVQYPDCNPENSDINGDDQISVADIGPFVAMLTGG